jgi:NAD(P)-dependent dehydrogenase (short-subunit alcohol dehydrogenase family)
MLKSFAEGTNALVVGAGGGIGGALTQQLLDNSAIAAVHAWARRSVNISHPKLKTHVVDITDEASIELAASSISRIGLVVVATGLLHTCGFPEKSWRELGREQLMQSFLVNTIGPALVAKHVLPLLPRDDRAVFAVLSARVGSVSDNRLGGWYSYRASKAALNQIMRTLSIELSRRRPRAICVGLHPGTVDTKLSKPFQSNVRTDKLFSAQRAAVQLLSVIDHLEVADSGRLIAWNGRPIPF